MNLNKEIWTKKDYQEFANYLIEIKEDTYANFHKKLVTTKYPILGIRSPKLKNIAKEITKGNYESFLKQVGSKYYEEIYIEGRILEKTKDLKRIENYVSKIDNWALCDSITLNFISNNIDEYFDYFLSFLNDPREYYIRYGLIILLGYYTKEKYAKKIFKAIDKIKNDDYYVKMGIAWLLCEMYIKVPQPTEEYLKNSKLKDWTINKAISKIRESYRVSQENKDYLNTLKRKKDKK